MGSFLAILEILFIFALGIIEANHWLLIVIKLWRTPFLRRRGVLFLL